MNQPRASGVGRALLAFVLLSAATPPRWFPLAEWLVLPGLMACYSLFTAAARPLRWAWLLGAAYTLLFSFSVRHVTVTGYLAIGATAGLYWILAAAVVRWLHRWPGPLVFGLAMAVTHWLRAEMVEIPYPHGQPCHCLWMHPFLLGPVRWGGEALLHLLLAGLAAALVDLGRSWRLAVPNWTRATVSVAAITGVWLLLCLFGPPRPTPPVTSVDGVRIAAIEPAFEAAFQFRPDFGDLFSQRLLEPTEAAAGRAVAEPPDLLLWPESTWPDELVPGDAGGLRWRYGGARLPALHRDVRLLVGAWVHRVADGPSTPAAVLMDASAAYLDHHEKQVLVPGGEYLPFARWLPAGLRELLGEAVRQTMGEAPSLVPGRSRPPLRTASGVPFGGLHCYDNAFPGPGREQVGQGARFLCVLSNESWYRGGAELDQLAAMTVFRALETGTPLVRCTVDGASLAVDGEGHILVELPRDGRPAAKARILTVFLPLGPGALGPMAWLSLVLPWVLVALIGLGLLHGARPWARLSPVRPSRSGGSEGDLESGHRSGGS